MSRFGNQSRLSQTLGKNDPRARRNAQMFTATDLFMGDGMIVTAGLLTDNLATNSAIEYVAGQKRIKVKTGGGITRDADGLSITSGKSLEVASVATKIDDYTILPADAHIRVDASSKNIIITLLTAVGNTGASFRIKKVDTSTHTVTLKGNGVEEIDGDNEAVMTEPDEALLVMGATYDGESGWDIL